MDLGVLKQCLRDEAMSSSEQNLVDDTSSIKTGKNKDTPAQTPSSPATEKNMTFQDQICNPHRLIMDIIFR